LKNALPESVRRLLRLFVALTLVAWLAHRVGLRAILDEFEKASVGMVVVATLLLALDSVAKARNWQQLMLKSLNSGVSSVSVPLFRVLIWFFAGGFLGAIVPSSASTDACRVVLAARTLRGHAAACTASIVTLNALGLFTGCLLGMAGMATMQVAGSLPVVLAPVALLFLSIIVLVPVLYGALAWKREAVLGGLERISRRWPAVSRAIGKFVDALLVFQHAHVHVLPFLLVSALGLLAQTGMFAVTASAVGIEMPFALWMVLVPLTRIVALVPVSIADFGLIQAAHVWVLSLFGVPPSQSFALSTLFAIEGLLIHSTLGSFSFLLKPPDLRLDGPKFVG
jgi:hypothetical protein